MSAKTSNRKIAPKPLRARHAGHESRPKPGTRLEEVLQSAANIFFAKGFHATSIEDVARDVGMLKGSLYYYIKSKDDLLFKLLLAGIEDGDAFIAQQIDPAGEPVAQLERAIRAQIDYIIQNRVPFGLFLHEFDSLSGKRQHKLISVMSRYNNRFVELVRRGQEQGKLIEGEPWLIVQRRAGDVQLVVSLVRHRSCLRARADQTGVPAHGAAGNSEDVADSLQNAPPRARQERCRGKFHVRGCTNESGREQSISNPILQFSSDG